MPKPTPSILRVIPEVPADARSALARCGWRNLEKAENARPTGVVSVWEAPDRQAVLSWIHDEIAGFEYFLIAGPDRESALANLAGEIVFRTPTDVLTSIANAADERELGRFARELGLIACGPFDLDVFKVLAGLLNSRHPALQGDALIAAGYAAWPELADAFERLEADAETQEELRAEARAVRAGLEASGWNSSFRE